MAYYDPKPGPSSAPDVIFQALQVSVASVTSAALTVVTAAAPGETSYTLAGNNTVLAPPISSLSRLQHTPGVINSSSQDDSGLLAGGTAGTSGYLTTMASPSPGSGGGGGGNPLEAFTVYWIALYINRYYLWVVFAFGFPGNIVSFLTILHMKPFSSPTIYVAALALVDNSCLVFKMLFFLLTKYDAPLGNAGCGTLSFLGSFTAQLANWLLVAMTLERCLAICLPLRVGSICTR